MIESLQPKNILDARSVVVENGDLILPDWKPEDDERIYLIVHTTAGVLPTRISGNGVEWQHLMNMAQVNGKYTVSMYCSKPGAKVEGEITVELSDKSRHAEAVAYRVKSYQDIEDEHEPDTLSVNVADKSRVFTTIR